MKVLILGANGQLGRCLKDQFKKSDYKVIAASKNDLDITNFKKTEIAINQIMPNIIVNAAAYTAVDKAEKEKEKSDLINHLSVKNISNICYKNKIWLIHISTDYVFDGLSNKPYTESDFTKPQTEYGISKLKGENSICNSGCNFIIIRTSWIFSEYGNNFLKTMLSLSKENNHLKVVGDQFGCPTYAQDIAFVILQIIPQLAFKADAVGIYHYCGNIICSWYEFAEEIFSIAKEKGMIAPKISSILTEEFPSLANRPKYSFLETSNIENVFGVKASDWKSGLRRAMSKL